MGLDFENVTLVGVILADQLPHLPRFRAYERSYQPLTQVQVAGRSQQGQSHSDIYACQRRPHLFREAVSAVLPTRTRRTQAGQIRPLPALCGLSSATRTALSFFRRV